MKYRNIYGYLFAVIALVFWTLCPQGAMAATAPGDVHWGQYISHHSTGEVSKKATLKVVFSQDMADALHMGKPFDKIIISPQVAVDVYFENARELLIVPKSSFNAETLYTIKVNAKDFPQIPDALGEFSFNVQIMKQGFEIQLDNLETSSTDDKVMNQRGSLITRDFESSLVEMLLSAKLDGKFVKLAWSHNPDGRHHDFTVSGITRKQSESRELIIYWNGYLLGIENEGKRKVTVPSIAEFKVVEVVTRNENGQHVQIVFSDALDTGQNLNGLVTLSSGTATFRIEGNTIKAFPQRVASGTMEVTVHPGVRGDKGQRLGSIVRHTLMFLSQKPAVRFVGKGVIMPENKNLTIPFEAVNVNAVQVTAFEIYEDNLGQFFQTNKYDGRSQLGRVGRYIWQKTIKLSDAAPDKWGRYMLDATELLQKHPGTLFRLTLSVNRGNSLYSCSRQDALITPEPAFVMKSYDGPNQRQRSGWDGIESYYGRSNNWNDRKDPCKNAYYKYSNETKSSRNFLASNIGIIAKRGAGDKINIATTNIRTADPLAKVKVVLYNFQNQPLGTVTTDGNGLAEVVLDGIPFYLTAEKGSQRGYLKMSSGLALPTSHFDVGGDEVRQGIKGHIYAERGVWRPGDAIYLTFVIEDKGGKMPDSHPVTMELYNPKGQMVRSVTSTKPLEGFYAFKLQTSEEDITGTWTAMARVGGLSFAKKLKIETVVPNRLKLDLNVGGDVIYKDDMPLDMKIFGQWLHGAKASGLKADVSVRLRSRPTSFGRFKDYIFDDPARAFSSVKQKVFEGNLDSEGNASFKGNIVADNAAPGMLTAQFYSRIFEEGGAFSSSTFMVPFHPYGNYVGIKLPKGDQSRGMLLTDIKHKVSIGTLDAHGNPVSLKNIRITLYKINWKWWWDKSSDSLANYSSSRHSGAIMEGTVSTDKGEGSWEFEVKYPQWGRYLMRACDLEGNHCTGKVFYMDWPGWAGRAKEEKGVGASALTLYTDKTKYTVGETATVVIPSAKQGRALMSLESGTRLLEQRWINLSDKETRIPIKITAAMAPNIYVNVMMIQPHVDKKNDLPIRLYGIVPIEVEAPATVLHPVIKTSDEYAPQSRVKISVSEADGRPMTYTLALVDEGLLGLTNFMTPNLHKEFYKREALGVHTWDMFDEVVGAYGGKLERLLSLGGDEGLAEDGDQKKDRRFPPVVRFLGPFKLKKGQQSSHSVDLPLYVGAVRVMVVAGRAGSYGSADKSVPVRQPLMIQSTLPRVLGPGEELTVPVSIFTASDAIKSVELSLKADPEFFTVIGDSKVIVHFEGKGEKIGFLHLKTKEKPGMAKLSFKAVAGIQEAAEEISIELRSPNARSIRVQRAAIEPGQSWDVQAVPHGLAGTNRMVLEVSAVPPFNLEKRMSFLIRYPHGCIEQTTSSVFPQLYLPKLVSLEPDRRKRVDRNIVAGIERLRLFQLPGGAFSYWPNSGGPSTWGTNYAGHFLIEAERLGYQVPAGMKQSWLNFQKTTARAWTTGGSESTLEQAYRLYTLALAGSPELGAMNRLRESGRLSNAARWQLATAYQIVGLSPVAVDLVASAPLGGDSYKGEGRTYGSSLRDQSIILLGLVAMKDYSRSRDMFESIAAEMAKERWHSTQTTAYSLLAMARFVGDGAIESFKFDLSVNSGRSESISSSVPIVQQPLASISESGGSLHLANPDRRVLYAALISEGIPAPGNELDSSEGLSLSASFMDADGRELDPARLTQGADVWVEITVRNLKQQAMENLALSQMVPSGWQIHNARLNEGVKNAELDYQDIRDDRVLSYFRLKQGESRKIKMLVNASFLGHYYLPGWTVEAMYDATVNARLRGRWVDIVK